MPARSNVFQAVVYTLHRYLSREATVQESAMLVDKITGEEREVDVLVTGRLSGYRIVMAIECRDRGRRAPVTWVEEMHAKHADLQIDKLILVSRTGFTKAAKTKAEHLDIETIQFEEPSPTAQAKVVGHVERLILEAFYARTLLLFRTRPGDALRETELMGHEEVLHAANGSFSASGKEVIDALLCEEPVIPAILRVDGGHGTLIELTCAPGVHLDREGVQVPLHSLLIIIEMKEVHTPFDLQAGRLRASSVAYAQEAVAGGDVTLALNLSHH